MLGTLNYLLILALVAAYAFVRGRGDERYAAAICVGATAATHGLMLIIGETYARVELGLMLVDLLAFIAFVVLALRSDRFWPLWVAGFQLTTISAHAIKAAHLDLLPQAYAAASKFWVYPIFLTIVVGTWRSHHRRLEAQRART